MKGRPLLSESWRKNTDKNITAPPFSEGCLTVDNNSFKMDELSKARKTIDAIDEQFARLFEQRMKAVKELASFKAEHSLPVFDESRENELLIKNASLITPDFGYKSLFH